MALDVEPLSDRTGSAVAEAEVRGPDFDLPKRDILGPLPMPKDEDRLNMLSVLAAVDSAGDAARGIAGEGSSTGKAR